MAGKNWQIEGRYVEYCSCDRGCPCETIADPTYGYCTGLVAFKIDKGWCEDVRLDDLAVAATFYFPRAIHHGQGVLQPILDERADEAQRNALFYIRRGPAGRHDVPNLLGHYRDDKRTRYSPRSSSNGTSRNAGRGSRLPMCCGRTASRYAIP